MSLLLPLLKKFLIPTLGVGFPLICGFAVYTASQDDEGGYGAVKPTSESEDIELSLLEKEKLKKEQEDKVEDEKEEKKEEKKKDTKPKTKPSVNMAGALKALMSDSGPKPKSAAGPQGSSLPPPPAKQPSQTLPTTVLTTDTEDPEIINPKGTIPEPKSTPETTEKSKPLPVNVGVSESLHKPIVDSEASLEGKAETKVEQTPEASDVVVLEQTKQVKSTIQEPHQSPAVTAQHTAVVVAQTPTSGQGTQSTEKLSTSAENIEKPVITTVGDVSSEVVATAKGSEQTDGRGVGPAQKSASNPDSSSSASANVDGTGTDSGHTSINSGSASTQTPASKGSDAGQTNVDPQSSSADLTNPDGALTKTPTQPMGTETVGNKPQISEPTQTDADSTGGSSSERSSLFNENNELVINTKTIESLIAELTPHQSSESIAESQKTELSAILDRLKTIQGRLTTVTA